MIIFIQIILIVCDFLLIKLHKNKSQKHCVVWNMNENFLRIDRILYIIIQFGFYHNTHWTDLKKRYLKCSKIRATYNFKQKDDNLKNTKR